MVERKRREGEEEEEERGGGEKRKMGREGKEGVGTGSRSHLSWPRRVGANLGPHNLASLPLALLSTRRHGVGRCPSRARERKGRGRGGPEMCQPACARRLYDLGLGSLEDIGRPAFRPPLVPVTVGQLAGLNDPEQEPAEAKLVEDAWDTDSAS